MSQLSQENINNFREALDEAERQIGRAISEAYDARRAINDALDELDRVEADVIESSADEAAMEDAADLSDGTSEA